mmetsp:Transcript_18418/g.41663  ORF Transcript_18418/g.41663 Transcript_18418/m.41663 type:complete len:713 (+) Transcript_18418:87-2225(+)
MAETGDFPEEVLDIRKASALSTTGKMNVMRAFGLHVMTSEWASSGAGVGRIFSTSMRMATIFVDKSEERLYLPVQTCTTVGDVKAALAEILKMPTGALEFYTKAGLRGRRLKSTDEVPSTALVKGITSLRRQRHGWPHPTVIIGGGYNGIKYGMRCIKDGQENFVIFERKDQLGGHQWLSVANKYSRLQTEFQSFSLAFGSEFTSDSRCQLAAGPKDYWPDRATILEHMQQTADDFGLTPMVRLNTNVARSEMHGRRDQMERAYVMHVHPTAGGDEFPVISSVVMHFPGHMTRNRLIEFQGEETFGGHIGYGMGDEIPYDHLEGNQTAIVGGGAFAIESVRICCEHGAKKIFLITRKKNLVCPRAASWLVHQAPAPIPAKILLQLFEPMYTVANLPSPFSYATVFGKKDGPSVTIMQSSRFGISDVPFLALAHGKLEIIEDNVKRLSPGTVHVSRGVKLEVSNIIKAIGMLGDFKVDELHQMKELVGFWADGDYRRCLFHDPPGIHFSNFDQISIGKQAYEQQLGLKYFVDNPKEYFRLEALGVMDMLPKNKATDERPAYVYDIRHLGAGGQTLMQMSFDAYKGTDGVRKWRKQQMAKVHPIAEVLKRCKEEWDQYQNKWREQGSNTKPVSYPYDKAYMNSIVAAAMKAASAQITDDGTLISYLRNLPLDEEYLSSSKDWWVNNMGEAKFAWVISGKAKPQASAKKRAASAG